MSYTIKTPRTMNSTLDLVSLKVTYIDLLTFYLHLPHRFQYISGWYKHCFVVFYQDSQWLLNIFLKILVCVVRETPLKNKHLFESLWHIYIVQSTCLYCLQKEKKKPQYLYSGAQLNRKGIKKIGPRLINTVSKMLPLFCVGFIECVL